MPLDRKFIQSGRQEKEECQLSEQTSQRKHWKFWKIQFILIIRMVTIMITIAMLTVSYDNHGF